MALRADVSPVWESVRGSEGISEGTLASNLLKRDGRLRRALGFVDVAGAYVALLFAISVIHSQHGTVHLRPTALLITPFVLLVAKSIGLYDRDQHILNRATINEVPSIFYLSVLYALAVWLAEAFLFQGWLARPQVFALTLAGFGTITAGRTAVRLIARAVTPAERCIVLGNGADALRIASKLQASPPVNAVVVGRVALHAEDLGAVLGLKTLGDLASLGRVIGDHQAERVIIAPDGHDQEEILQAVRMVKAFGVKVSVLPRLLEVVGSSSTFDDVDGLTLLGVRQYGLSQSSDFLKRSMDIAAASLGILLLAPLLLMLAIAVKLDSRGPVFFRQMRIGRRGQRFWMLKFRSMVDGADQLKDQLRARNEAQGGLFKISDDPRVTRVGRLLRRTSLDELSQLLNVLKGEMSLVGPRPLVPDEDALIEGWQRRRLAVKPGMTGLWQIFGSARIPMQEMVKIDYIYGANWSVWLDLKILLRTLPYVLRRRGL